MYDFIERLIRAGMNPDNATVVVIGFMRELDFDGLKEYVAEFEAVSKICAIYETKIPHVKYA